MKSSTYDKISEYLINTTLNKISADKNETCWGDSPGKTYFVSNISPPEEDISQDSQKDPDLIGIKFDPTSREVTIDISISIFYPDFPTYEEYKQKNENADSELDPHPLSNGFYRKKTFSEKTEVAIDSLPEELGKISKTLNQKLQSFYIEVLKSNPGWKTTDLGDMSDLSAQEFESKKEVFENKEPAYEEFLGYLSNEPNIVSVSCDKIDTEKSTCKIVLRNKIKSELDNRGVFRYYSPEIEVSGSFNSWEYDMEAADYRYNQQVWAVGTQTSTNTELESGEGSISTEPTPRRKTYEVDYEDKYNVSFSDLSKENGIQILTDIKNGMYSYAEKWEDGELRPEGISDDEKAEYRKSLDKFKSEISRFENGIEILQSSPKARKAFQLMNKTNFKMHYESEENGFEKWRLFQIVFIVSNIERITKRENITGESYKTPKDEAEVLHFPTGGGKTEAYIGLTQFSLFFDRLRGKQSGMTSWIRFPLRLLSRQQTGRFLESIMFANDVKKEVNLNGDDFTLGAYMGGHDTKNRLDETLKNEINGGVDEIPEGKRDIQLCFVVTNCPKCDNDVELDYVFKDEKTVHRCDSCGELPVTGIDDEIYRSVPSVLIGSLDRIALMSMTGMFSNLIGNVSSKCPIHGYGKLEKCVCDGCEQATPVSSEDEFYDPIPSLHLIDEVHLLNEERGGICRSL
jgi:hypothetical protein